MCVRVVVVLVVKVHVKQPALGVVAVIVEGHVVIAVWELLLFFNL